MASLHQITWVVSLSQFTNVDGIVTRTIETKETRQLISISDSWAKDSQHQNCKFRLTMSFNRPETSASIGAQTRNGTEPSSPEVSQDICDTVTNRDHVVRLLYQLSSPAKSDDTRPFSMCFDAQSSSIKIFQMPSTKENSDVKISPHAFQDCFRRTRIQRRRLLRLVDPLQVEQTPL